MTLECCVGSSLYLSVNGHSRQLYHWSKLNMSNTLWLNFLFFLMSVIFFETPKRMLDPYFEYPSQRDSWKKPNSPATFYWQTATSAVDVCTCRKGSFMCPDSHRLAIRKSLYFFESKLSWTKQQSDDCHFQLYHAKPIMLHLFSVKRKCGFKLLNITCMVSLFYIYSVLLDYVHFIHPAARYACSHTYVMIYFSSYGQYFLFNFNKFNFLHLHLLLLRSFALYTTRMNMGTAEWRGAGFRSRVLNSVLEVTVCFRKLYMCSVRANHSCN